MKNVSEANSDFRHYPHDYEFWHHFSLKITDICIIFLSQHRNFLASLEGIVHSPMISERRVFPGIFRLTGLPSVQGNMLPWCPLDLFLTFGCPSVLTGAEFWWDFCALGGHSSRRLFTDPSELQPWLFSFNIFVKEKVKDPYRLSPMGRERLYYIWNHSLTVRTRPEWEQTGTQ